MIHYFAHQSIGSFTLESFLSFCSERKRVRYLRCDFTYYFDLFLRRLAVHVLFIFLSLSPKIVRKCESWMNQGESYFNYCQIGGCFAKTERPAEEERSGEAFFYSSFLFVRICWKEVHIPLSNVFAFCPCKWPVRDGNEVGSVGEIRKGKKSHHWQKNKKGTGKMLWCLCALRGKGKKEYMKAHNMNAYVIAMKNNLKWLRE